MDLNKKPTIEQLVKIAKAHKDRLFKHDNALDIDDATKFCIAFKIKAGKHQVTTKVVYNAYKAWCSTPVSSKSFLTKFTEMFPVHRVSTNHYYLLNYEPANLKNAVAKVKVNG